jgi:hypothetical protein
VRWGAIEHEEQESKWDKKRMKGNGMKRNAASGKWDEGKLERGKYKRGILNKTRKGTTGNWTRRK